jgi:archaellum component FlaC
MSGCPLPIPILLVVSFLGFAGEFRYLASTRDYNITLNPDLIVETKIIDEKVDEVPEDVNTFSKSFPVLEQMSQADKMTRKDFRKLVNEYEKEAMKEREEVEVISNRKYSVDSMAKKRDLSYWDSIRPVKLTVRKSKAMKEMTVLPVSGSCKESEVDSVAKKARRGFKPLEIVTGGSYSFGKGRSAGFDPNLTKLSYNTVEGFKFGIVRFLQDSSKVPKWQIRSPRIGKSWTVRPEFRYGFSSEQAYGTLDIRRSVNKGRPGYTYGLDRWEIYFPVQR